MSTASAAGGPRRWGRATAFVLAALVASVGCERRGQRPPEPDGPALPAVAPAALLRDRLRRGPRPLVLDVRPRTAFDLGHISGSISAPLEDLMPLATDDLDGAFRARVTKVQQTAGARPDFEIVAVDRGGVAGFERAATLCWTLSLAGIERCRVLDGGLPAWEAARGELTRGPETALPIPAALKIPQRPNSMASLDALRRATGGAETALIDVSLGQGASELPGAMRLPLGVVLSADGRLHQTKLEQLAAGIAVGSESDIIVIGETALDGAAGWFLIRHQLRAPAVRLFPGGFARWRTLPQPAAGALAPE